MILDHLERAELLDLLLASRSPEVEAIQGIDAETVLPQGMEGTDQDQ